MIRSALFVPGDQLELVDKLRRLRIEDRPDLLILDLEDSVAPSGKSAARAAVAAAIANDLWHGDLAVRINAGQAGAEDLAAIHSVGGPITCVPKADHRSISMVAEAIESRGGSVRLWALIESAAGLRDLDPVCSTPGVVQLALGEVDLCADLGVRAGTMHALWPLRMQVVAASARSGLRGPIGPASVDLNDLERFETEGLQLRDAGFSGQLAIHPKQLPRIHRVFTPTRSEIADARRVLDRYEEALKGGQGVITDEDGSMVDEAVVRSARRVLAQSSGESCSGGCQ
ncbi:MAG: CoA ester lyase [Acidimicrobiales bacterium mtb01]|nr:CoA ester lyase [Actinomycetota bacterium]TEX45674.1 MAG: CoA ester lyase [Acidimicrobiales bacterium mtb01]